MVKSDQVIELRFTRSRQAVVMVAWALGFLLLSVLLFILHQQRHSHPPALFWSWLPLPFVILFAWLAWNHLRHPYLALTRVGLEIYPFFLPAQNMHLVLWQQIRHAEVIDQPPQLILTRADSEDAKIFITLEPMPARQRALLAKALQGVQDMREKVTASMESESVG
jgi:hypothetical protein